jgi:hypothetical protein
MTNPPGLPEEEWLTGEKAVELLMVMCDMSREDAEEVVIQFMMEHFDDVRWGTLH